MRMRAGSSRTTIGTYRRRLLALAVTIAMTGVAFAGGDWDATWYGGFDNGDNGGGNGGGDGAGDGVQIIVTGNQIVGFYYHGDYLDTDDGTVAADGSITFHWDGGEGTLSDPGGKRQLAIHETDKADVVIPLKRDE